MKLWDWQALNRQGIAAVIVSAVLMVWIYSSLEDRTKAPPGPLGHSPDSYMTDFVRTDFDVAGQIHTRLRAEHMDHFADDRSTELRAPVLDVYKDPQRPWRVQSTFAWVDVNQDVLIMNGHVVVTRQRADNGVKELQVSSESALVFPKTDAIEGNEAVTIEMPNIRISGVGYRANLRTHYVELLHRVKSHYEFNKANP